MFLCVLRTKVKRLREMFSLQQLFGAYLRRFGRGQAQGRTGCKPTSERQIRHGIAYVRGRRVRGPYHQGVRPRQILDHAAILFVEWRQDAVLFNGTHEFKALVIGRQGDPQSTLVKRGPGRLVPA